MVRKILAAAWLSTSACACIAGHDAAPAASRCGFESVAIPGFVAADTGAATPGRSRPVDGGIELCSATAGFGSTSDEHRHAARSAVADFVLVAAIDPQTVGEASVGFARNSQDDRGPRVRASLRRTGDGGATLRVGVRTDANASESVLVDQPIDRVDHVVRLSREDAVISVALDDPEAPDGFVTIATVPTLGTPLEGAGDVFLAQASGTVGAVARAIFRRVSLTADPSVADPECADAVEADPGATTAIVGRALQHVDRVFVDGQTAAVQASASRVVFEMPAFESNALRSIEVESRGRRFALRSPVLVHGSSTAPPPADPELDEIVDAAGAVVRALSAGDDAFLVVSGLARIDGLRVFLGDVEAELLGDSTKTKLHVRVPRIRYDHLGCPDDLRPLRPLREPVLRGVRRRVRRRSRAARRALPAARLR